MEDPDIEDTVLVCVWGPGSREICTLLASSRLRIFLHNPNLPLLRALFWALFHGVQGSLGSQVCRRLGRTKVWPQFRGPFYHGAGCSRFHVRPMFRTG